MLLTIKVNKQIHIHNWICPVKVEYNSLTILYHVNKCVLYPYRTKCQHPLHKDCTWMSLIYNFLLYIISHLVALTCEKVTCGRICKVLHTTVLILNVVIVLSIWKSPQFQWLKMMKFMVLSLIFLLFLLYSKLFLSIIDINKYKTQCSQMLLASGCDTMKPELWQHNNVHEEVTQYPGGGYPPNSNYFTLISINKLQNLDYCEYLVITANRYQSF